MPIPLPKNDDLQRALDDFNTNYPRPKMQQLALGELFDLHVHYNDLYQWYHSKVGVYILWNDQHEIIRIGSATDDLYRRLNSYFDYRDDNGVIGIGWWKEGVGSRYIQVITVPKDQVFEALAIEKFLLDKLQPPLNKEGKIKYIEFRKKMLKELNRLAATYGWKQVNRSWHTISSK